MKLKSANTLIEDLKKSTKGNDGFQGKITTYEGEVAKTLKSSLNKRNSKVEMQEFLYLKAKATDIDYMTFKLKEKGELKLDEQGHMKGLKEMLDGLKVQDSQINLNQLQSRRLTLTNLKAKTLEKKGIRQNRIS